MKNLKVKTFGSVADAFFDFFCRRGCLLVMLACVLFWAGIYFLIKQFF